MMNRPHHLQRSARGFTLIELSLVVALSGLMTVWGLWAMAGRMEASRAEAQADLLVMLKGAVDSYFVDHFDELTTGQPVPGFANPMLPTVAELKAGGYLRATFADTGLYGSGYRVRIERVPASCIAPACDLAGTATLSAPMLKGTQVNWVSLGAAVQRIGGQGGFSASSSPAVISGYEGKWTVTNPVGTVAGILGVTSSYQARGLGAFVRKDGSTAMEANLDMGGQSLENLKLATLGASCAGTPQGALASASSGMLLSCQSTRWAMASDSVYWKSPVSAYGALPGCSWATLGEARAVLAPSVGAGARGYVCDGASWRALAVDNSGNLTVPATLATNNITLNNSSTISSPGVLHVEASSNLYLKPWSAGDVVVGGGGGSGRLTAQGLVTANNGVWVNGRTTANEYLQMNGVATEGAGCWPNGLVGRSAVGKLLSCQSGVWAGTGLAGQATSEGWAELGGGMMIQWGTSDAPVGRNQCSSATFSRAFSGAPFSAVATPYDANRGTNHSLTTQSYGSTGMVICQTGLADSGPVYATYMVIGRKP